MDEPIKILSVDDEVNVLRSFQRVFLDENYDIVTATSGEEGLGILEKETSIGIVLSDFKMPGMNGLEFLERVNDRWPYIIGMVVSGYAETDRVIAAIKEGKIFKFIPKPWSDYDLKETVGQAVQLLKEQEKKLSK